MAGPSAFWCHVPSWIRCQRCLLPASPAFNLHAARACPPSPSPASAHLPFRLPFLVQGFDCGELLYYDYVRLKQEREAELGASYASERTVPVCGVRCACVGRRGTSPQMRRGGAGADETAVRQAGSAAPRLQCWHWAGYTVLELAHLQICARWRVSRLACLKRAP